MKFSKSYRKYLINCDAGIFEMNEQHLVLTLSASAFPADDAGICNPTGRNAPVN